MKNSSITQSKFEGMLEWLNPDRDQAVKKYEKIRRRLIEIMAGRGCHEAEDLSDEVIDRVVAKIDDVTKNYEGDPAYYFYGVAKKVLLEYWKPKPLPDPPDPVWPPDDDEDDEWRLKLLEECLALLPPDDRDLVLNYYSKEGRDKIVYRTEMASKLGIGLNALRIRVFRIRIVIKDCISSHVTAGS